MSKLDDWKRAALTKGRAEKAIRALELADYKLNTRLSLGLYAEDYTRHCDGNDVSALSGYLGAAIMKRLPGLLEIARELAEADEKTALAEAKKEALQFLGAEEAAYAGEQ